MTAGDWILCTTAALGVLGWVIEHMRRRRAEAALLAMARRGDAPFLELYRGRVVYLCTAVEGRAVQWNVSDGNILCVEHQELTKDVRPLPVVLLYVQSGPPVRSMRVELDGQTIGGTGGMPEDDTAHEVFFVAYDYSPESRDKRMLINVYFETVTGRQDKHVYETRHGRWILRRIDPPLP